MGVLPLTGPTGLTGHLVSIAPRRPPVALASTMGGMVETGGAPAGHLEISACGPSLRGRLRGLQHTGPARLAVARPVVKIVNLGNWLGRTALGW